MAALKSFDLTLSDMVFLLDQINFQTIKIIGYDANGQPLYGYVNALGNMISLGTLGSFDALDPAFSQYYSAVDASGIRNPDGTFNNLTNSNTYSWGATNQDFMRLVPADYNHKTQPLLPSDPNAFYATNSFGTGLAPTGNANYANPLASVIDYTPRMISQTITSFTALEHLALPSSSGGADLATETLTFTASDNTLHTETFIRNVNSVALDPSLSGWNTLFGQFFDHGLDFINKPGGNATITIALATTDPLYRAPGTNGAQDPGVTSITINRATPDAGTGVNGVEAQYTNHTSPYIDQSQSYGSDTQITNLLREWVLNPNYDASLPLTDPNSRKYLPGTNLFDGHKTVAYNSAVFNDATANGLGAGTTTRTIPTLNELRAEMRATDRADLTWEDISNYRARGEHGEILDLNSGVAGIQAKLTGQALVLDMNPHTDAAHIDISNTGILAQTLGATAMSFGAHGDVNFTYTDTNNVSHTTSLFTSGGFNTTTNEITATDAKLHAIIGEILMESIGDHYIAGDGRANENFGLTALHHVFHENHNVQMINLEKTILAETSAVDRNKWQTGVSDGAGGFFHDANGNYTLTDLHLVSATSAQISWNLDEVFNATKIINEMEYQHVAIDQYARRVTPDLPEFVTYDSNINANISLEYSQAAFRFGHSQLRETIDVLDPNGAINGAITHYLLKDSFLNPGQFADVGAASIVQGMTRQVSNEVDEFLTPALQQSLLGQPLDLAAINIARGRDVGLPTLNETRKAMYDALLAERAANAAGQPGPHAKIQLDLLRPYNSWNEFAANMAHRESLVNFIAAYSFDGDVAHAQAIIDADATGVVQFYSGGSVTALQAGQFLSGQVDATTHQYLQAGADGFDKIDLWVGGLAESHVLGGILGSTFNVIFEDQMERLMDGDRFYYLYRLGNALPAFTDLNQSIVTEQFKDIIERTTGVTHLNGDVMSHADSILELSQTANVGASLLETDGTVRMLNGNPVIETAQNAHKYGVFDELSSITGLPIVTGQTLAGFAAAHGGYGIYSGAGSNTALNGMDYTALNPQDHTYHTYILDIRPDSPDTGLNGNPTYGYNSHEVLAGTDYNDFLDTGDGDDTVYGGAGDDILIGNGGGDHIYGGDGADIMFGGGTTAGADVEDFMDGGNGDDTMYGGANNGAVEVMIGGAGNDHVYGESGIEEMYGMNGDDYIDAGSDTDLAFGGYGNDQLYGGEGPDELHGDAGDDIISGGTGTDKLLGEAGDDILLGGIGQGVTAGDSDELIGAEGFDMAAYSDLNGKLDNAVDLNNQNLVATPGTPQFQPFNQLLTGIEGAVGTKLDDQFSAGAGLIGDDINNWLIGGSGNDGLRGNGGNDIIIGGSMYLDSLIGTYNDTYTHVLADGTSHRVADNAVLSGGLLAASGMAGERHYTDLLRSEAFKDFKLGDGGTDGTADFVEFSGNRANYTITQVNFTDARSNVIVAYKVVDTRPGSPNGTDLVVGVEQFRFADKTLTTAQLLNSAPTGALSFTASDNGGSLARLTVSGANLFDADNISATNPLGTVTIPNNGRVWQTSTDGGVTWANFPTGNNSGQQSGNGGRPLNQGATSGRLIRAVGTYTDGGGNSESVTSPAWNLIVGTTGNNNGAGALSGTTSTLVGDIIFGLAGADILNGLAGNDYLYGGDGVDTLNGGDGNDTLDGGSGNDTLNGGNGDDTYVYGNGDTITDTGGNDKIVAGGTFSLSAFGTIENLTVTGGNVNATGNSLANTLTGTDGNNTLDGGTGADNMIGANGNDTYIVDNVGDTIVELANGGTDTARSSVTFTLSDNVENLILTSLGNIDGTGNAIDNVMTGNIGNNILLGLGGNDRFVAIGGNDGNDTYNGGLGIDTYDLSATSAAATVNLALGTSTSTSTGSDTLVSIENVIGSSAGDTIIGNSVTNILTGGLGHDVMTGGGGHDIFVFTNINQTTAIAATRDQITDFRAASELGGATESDIIDLSGIDAFTNQFGNQAFAFDGLTVGSNHARGHIGFHYEGTTIADFHTIIDGQTNGGVSFNFQIDLAGHILLTAADFLL